MLAVYSTWTLCPSASSVSAVPLMSVLVAWYTTTLLFGAPAGRVCLDLARFVVQVPLRGRAVWWVGAEALTRARPMRTHTDDTNEGFVLVMIAPLNKDRGCDAGRGVGVCQRSCARG